MKLRIQSVPCFNGPATQLVVDDGHVNLGEGANFQYALLNADNQVVAGPGRSSLTQEQYDNWGESDRAAAEAIAANIGVTPIPEE